MGLTERADRITGVVWNDKRRARTGAHLKGEIEFF